ncbi:MAG: enoyl-CoA hydratase [Candidatus Muproteobacteria bacterium RBG_16_60_9]|uniref:Enoyl-CoA hydratase n=1 Tax=Candidatus Muproteobacteria bacterium RBG_16_60_9 TaxID=1817755 RepID=A0A1F6UYB1_9PROT|nr:MAG: enoyl-CoA hydratase [Candidatus Muproteobacteria bacterium RBG_16_60_9]
MTTSLPHCQTLQLDLKGPHLHVTLNRPESRNALTEEMVRELLAVIDAITDDRDVRSVVLRGAGGTFCSGGDIKGFQTSFSAPAPAGGERDPIAANNRRFGEFMTRMNSLPQTVVAVVEGSAFGGGLGLVCVSDVAICHADTRFAISETGLGIPPAQIAPFIAQRIGLTQARRLALTGERFDGREAGRLGLVHFVCDDTAALEQRLAQVLENIGRCAPGANAATKAILLASTEQPLAQVLDDAAQAFADALRGPEGGEGVNAYLEKRRPAWRQD